MFSGVGIEIRQSAFNAVVCSKAPKRCVIERNIYTIYLYNDKAFIRLKDENGAFVFLKLGEGDLQKLLLSKMQMTIGLIDDMRDKDLNDFYNRRALVEVLTEIEELMGWFVEKNGKGGLYG